MCTRKIFGPDRCRQSVSYRICVAQNFFLGVERHHRDDRAEYLFLVRAALVRQAFDNDRFHEVSISAPIRNSGEAALYSRVSIHPHAGISAGKDGPALGSCEIDIRHDLVEMLS